MRRLKKYKKFSFYDKTITNHSLLSSIPSKIYKFKKPKWQILQSFGKRKKQKLFINNSVSKLKSYKQGWSFLKAFYKKGHIEKNNLNLYFDNIIKTSFWKKYLKSKNQSKRLLFLTCLVLPHFRIDIFLWKALLFKSPYESRQALQNKLVLINNRSVSGNYILKKGDVISFTKNVQLNFTSEFVNIFPFVESDYYSKTFVVLTNWFDLNFKDCIFFTNQFFDLNSFKNYL